MNGTSRHGLRGPARTRPRPRRAAERLADALTNAGHKDLADAARTGLYDELRSELADPRGRLVADLNSRGLDQLAARTIDREFDPSPAETSAWVTSEDGRTRLGQFDAGAYDAVLLRLVRGGMRLDDDMMTGLATRRIAAMTADRWEVDGNCPFGPAADCDEVHAAWNLVGRTGGTGFVVGHHHGHRQGLVASRWHATAHYRGRRVMVQHQPTPAVAAEALVGKVLAESACDQCGGAATLNAQPSWPTNPSAGRWCRWRRYGPRWVGGCGCGL